MNGASCICQRRNGDPLRVYMDLEAGRKRSGVEDIFISYHAKDDVQSTYAGALFHNNRNYHVSSYKNNVRVLNFPPPFFLFALCIILIFLQLLFHYSIFFLIKLTK